MALVFPGRDLRGLTLAGGEACLDRLEAGALLERVAGRLLDGDILAEQVGVVLAGQEERRVR